MSLSCWHNGFSVHVACFAFEAKTTEHCALQIDSLLSTCVRTTKHFAKDHLYQFAWKEVWKEIRWPESEPEVTAVSPPRVAGRRRTGTRCCTTPRPPAPRPASRRCCVSVLTSTPPTTTARRRSTWRRGPETPRRRARCWTAAHAQTRRLLIG